LDRDEKHEKDSADYPRESTLPTIDLPELAQTFVLQAKGQALSQAMPKLARAFGFAAFDPERMRIFHDLRVNFCRVKRRKHT
jgi:hypothetical protein